MSDPNRPAWLDAVITTSYGAKDAATGAIHNAVDFALPSGTPVTAGIPGTVERAFHDSVGGNQVVVNSGGFRVIFAHLSDMLVKPGDSINSQTVIGRSGTSGTVTGPHLHVGVTDLKGSALDPILFYNTVAPSIGLIPHLELPVPTRKGSGYQTPSVAENVSQGKTTSGGAPINIGLPDFFKGFTPDNLWRAGFVVLGAVMIFTGARLYLRPDAASEQMREAVHG